MGFTDRNGIRRLTTINIIMRVKLSYSYTASFIPKDPKEFYKLYIVFTSGTSPLTQPFLWLNMANALKRAAHQWRSLVVLNMLRKNCSGTVFWFSTFPFKADSKLSHGVKSLKRDEYGGRVEREAFTREILALLKMKSMRVLTLTSKMGPGFQPWSFCSFHFHRQADFACCHHGSLLHPTIKRWHGLPQNEHL